LAYAGGNTNGLVLLFQSVIRSGLEPKAMKNHQSKIAMSDVEVCVVLKLEDKKTIVNEVSGVAKQALSLVAAEYSGLTVGQLTDLRKSARNAGVYMRVVRNTLAKRALDGTQFACMQEKLVGPLLLAFSNEDPGAAARLIQDFVKTNDKLKVKALAIDSQLLPPEGLKQLASLPTRDQAIALLMSVMNAPITKLVRTLAEPHAMLVRTVAAVRDQKQASA
jgi:large subunit ribosomal protein L10